MSLMKKISEDMTAAMRAKDQARLAPLRMAKAALMNRDVEKGREELAAREIAEIGTLEAYLPPPIDPAEIEHAVDEAIKEAGATSAKDLGRVMKGVMARLAGRGADGRLINETVRRKLIIDLAHQSAALLGQWIAGHL